MVVVVVVEVGLGIGELEQSGASAAKRAEVHSVRGREGLPCLH